MSDAEAVVQRQFDAYNAKDLDAWVATYAPDAEQYELHGSRLARGHAEIRARMAQRFTEPDLHAQLLGRTVMGAIVIDHERVTRNFPEGKGTVELLCIYEVGDGRIQRASFAFGQPVIAGKAATAK
jgi:putative hydrolase of HD superfamily